MKITILGYSGKIGMNLVKALQKTNHRIFIVTRKKNIKISGTRKPWHTCPGILRSVPKADP